jgi:hypothetical protein
MDSDDPKPAPGSLALVQDFVNTRNYLYGGEFLGDAEGATRRLTECGLLKGGESVGESERRRLVTLREALRELLLVHNGASEPGPDAEALNGLVASAALGVRFGADGRPALEPTAGDSPAERVVARLLAEVIWAEAEGKWERLKACRTRGAAGPSTTPPRTAPDAGATWTSAAPGTKCAHTASARSREPASLLPQPDTAAANGTALFTGVRRRVFLNEVRR